MSHNLWYNYRGQVITRGCWIAGLGNLDLPSVLLVEVQSPLPTVRGRSVSWYSPGVFAKTRLIGNEKRCFNRRETALV